jgi:hypothetical protein
LHGEDLAARAAGPAEDSGWSRLAVGRSRAPGVSASCPTSHACRHMAEASAAHTRIVASAARRPARRLAKLPGPPLRLRAAVTWCWAGPCRPRAGPSSGPLPARLRPYFSGRAESSRTTTFDSGACRAGRSFSGVQIARVKKHPGGAEKPCDLSTLAPRASGTGPANSPVEAPPTPVR